MKRQIVQRNIFLSNYSIIVFIAEWISRHIRHNWVLQKSLLLSQIYLKARCCLKFVCSVSHHLTIVQQPKSKRREKTFLFTTRGAVSSDNIFHFSSCLRFLLLAVLLRCLRNVGLRNYYFTHNRLTSEGWQEVFTSDLKAFLDTWTNFHRNGEISFDAEIFFWTTIALTKSKMRNH